MSDSQVIMIFVIFILLITTTGAWVMGAYRENNRINQQCLDQNSTMVYSDARAFCSKLIGSKND